MARVHSEEDWIRLFRGSLEPLYAFVARRAGADRALAEDVTQETWLRAVRAWRRAGPPREPLAWLQTTARRLLSNHFRDERRRPREGGAEALARIGDEPGKPRVIPSADEAGALQHALARLARRDAALLEAFHLDGESTRELAARHATSERAIEGRLRRARVKLRRILARGERHASPAPTLRPTPDRNPTT